LTIHHVLDTIMWMDHPTREGGDVPTLTEPPVYLDELQRLLVEHLDDLVMEYAPQAARHGVTEAQLRAWLSNVDERTGLPLADEDRLLSYEETATLYGVEVDTLRQWVYALNIALRDNAPITSACFIPPNIRKGAKVRLWDRARCILFGWRQDRLVPGTLIPKKRKPPGPPVRS
jgi:hypothetical protein